jgi:hypothetical protein
VPKRIAYFWCCWQEWFGHGSKHFSSFRKTTLLRWHRQGYRLFWKYTSRAASSKPKIPAETVALIKDMAAQNRRLRSGANPWRITQAGASHQQTHDPEVHATRV